MTSHSKSLEELVRELPPDRQDEVRNFVEALLAKQRANPGGASDLERLFGSWDGGDENSADSERIDADLAREYSNPHEPRD